mgnify:CR=1 FL=1
MKKNVGRRGFLTGCAGIGLAGFFLQPSTRVGWNELLLASNEYQLTPGNRIVVLVTLYGGNDGLNTLIPYSNSAYYDARSDLAYDEADVLKLDDDYALNPGLQDMAGAYRDGQLAILRGVGYPKPDRSHFRSVDIWQSASLDSSVSTGWIGRWLDTTDGNPVQALHLGPVLPRLAVGEKCSAAAFTSRVAPQPSHTKLMSALSSPDKRDSASMRFVCDSYRDTVGVNERFLPIFDDEGEASIGSLAGQLDAAAACIEAGMPTRVYSVQLGGFDTHADERTTQQALLAVLDGALARFRARLRGDRHGKNVVVMVYSEFGRRVAANSSDGTDHGTAGPVFILGEDVVGGFYGDDPGLKDLVGEDLKVTMDFRDIYNDILVEVLGADPEPVVGTGRKRIGFLTA